MDRPPRLAPDDPRPDRHLLALPGDVTARELESFARSRFAGAGRERSPVDVLRLSRHSSLHGPFALADDDARRLGLPGRLRTAFVVHAPRERGEPAYPGGDRDGLKRVLGAAMPVREEDRVLRWLLDVARRLGGAVRLADDDAAAVLAPDPAASVDLTVWSRTRLAPEWGLAAVRGLGPTARLSGSASLPVTAAPAAPPAAPAPAAPAAPLAELGERRRRRLLERAAAADAAAVATPPPPTGYGIQTDLGDDGLVVVEVGEEEVVPLALADPPVDPHADPHEPPAADHPGWTTYRVRWEPPDVEDLEREHATDAHRASRARARTLVRATAAALHAVVGGVVLDDVELPVDPAALDARDEPATAP